MEMDSDVRKMLQSTDLTDEAIQNQALINENEVSQLPSKDIDIELEEDNDNNLERFTEIAELTAITTSHSSKLKNQNSDISNLRQEVYKLSDLLSKLKFEMSNLSKNYVSEQTIREMINRNTDVYDKKIQTQLIDKDRIKKMETFNAQKDMNTVENKIKDLETKIYNQSTEMTALSDTLSSLLSMKEELSQLKYLVEKTLQTQINDIVSDYTGKSLDKKIQKWITVYHDSYKSVKLDFDRLYADNKELVESIKNDYNLVGNIKNEIKKELFNDIIEYNSKFRDFLENKRFIKYLEDLSTRTDKVLSNILREQETRKFFEELKKHIDQINK